MKKFAHLSSSPDQENNVGYGRSVSTESPSDDDARSQSSQNDNDTSRSTSAYVNISDYYDESSYSIPDVSSVCDDSEAFALALAQHNGNSNNNNAVGSTGMTFQDFLLCFDERVHSGADAKALTKTVSTASSSASSNKYQQFRQLLPNHHHKNQQLSSQQRLLRVRSADSSSNTHGNKVVLLPRFLWQPDDGLCCQAESVNHVMQNEQNDLRNQKVAMEGLVLFEEPAYGDDDKEGAFGEDAEQKDKTSVKTVVDKEEREPTERPRSASLGEQGFLPADGGTVEDPRYVPRPSSTTPGLREMSKLFHTSSLPDDKLAKTYHSWKVATTGNKPADEEDEILPPTVASMMPTPPLAPASPKNTLQASKVLLLTKSNSSPPAMFGKQMHRRTRSEDHQCLPRDGRSTGLPPRHDQSGENGDSGNGNGMDSKKGAKRHTMKNLFRRSRLPSFRKPKFSSISSGNKQDKKDAKAGTAADSDVASILASLEETHLEQQQTSRSNKMAGKPHQLQEQQQRSISCSPTKSLMSAQSHTQASGETHSDTSSLEDIFGDVEDDDFNDCYSESSQESHASEALDMFATSYLASDQDKFSGYYSKAGSKTSSWEEYAARKGDRNAMLSRKTELLRCGSVDTAKASNLTNDPVADHAKRLELQAFLNQQREEQQKLLNAPPIEFDAPDGDNVIRVRDAVCEIEVLPKSDFAAEF